MNIDVVIAYRIYPEVSKVPPIHSDNKFELSKLCLDSFKNSLDGINYKIFAILDNCPPEYKTLFENTFDKNDLEFFELGSTGNAGTFELQVKLLLEQNESEYIYFAEDDYLYLPGTFGEMLEIIDGNNGIDYVSPYDHPDYYNMDLHNYHSQIIDGKKRQWRTSATTCMTFLTKKSVISSNMDVFMSYTRGNYDASMWLSLTKEKLLQPSFIFKSIFSNDLYRRIIFKGWFYCWKQLILGKKQILATPLPSIATHMDSKCLAPSVDWTGLYK